MSTPERVTESQVAYLSAEHLTAAYREKSLSPVEATEALLARIERLNPTLHAFLHVDRVGALAAAGEAERRMLAGSMRGPLDGVPVTIKDLLDVKGLPTTSGSAVYREQLAGADSIVTGRLRAAGCVILGKTNTPEFGLIPTTENLLGEPCRNPWDLERTPGGSSGGASAAAAAGLAPLHVGTDGGGSVRIPAAFAGVFGLKPTYGRVARSGMSGMPLFSHTGPLTRTVTDTALMMDVIAGPDRRDPTSIPEPPARHRDVTEQPLGRPRIAFWADPWGEPIDPEVRGLVSTAARVFVELGAAVEEAAPETEPWRPTFVTIFLGDEYTAGGHLLGQYRDSLAPYTLSTLEAGARLAVPDYSRALRARERFCADMRRFFEQYDFLLTSVTAVPPFPIGRPPTVIAGQPVEGPLAATPFTAPFNITGQPAASVPCGFTSEGLPVGLQIVGRWGDDAGVLRACAAFERARPWQDHRPYLDTEGR